MNIYRLASDAPEFARPQPDSIIMIIGIGQYYSSAHNQSPFLEELLIVRCGISHNDVRTLRVKGQHRHAGRSYVCGASARSFALLAAAHYPPARKGVGKPSSEERRPLRCCTYSSSGERPLAPALRKRVITSVIIMGLTQPTCRAARRVSSAATAGQDGKTVGSRVECE